MISYFCALGKRRCVLFVGGDVPRLYKNNSRFYSSCLFVRIACRKSLCTAHLSNDCEYSDCMTNTNLCLVTKNNSLHILCYISIFDLVPAQSPSLNTQPELHHRPPQIQLSVSTHQDEQPSLPACVFNSFTITSIPATPSISLNAS